MRALVWGLTLLLFVAGGVVLLGIEMPPQTTPSECKTRESTLEVQYRDFGPTAVVLSHPCGDTQERPFVVFASYIGLVDGDYYTGQEPVRALLTPRDSPHFLFGWLARSLAKNGIASVRYDPIAIRSRKRGGPGFSGTTVVEEELLRLQRNDFSGLLAEVISRASEELKRTADAPVVLVSHSGGAFTVADYLDREDARGVSRPYGFVGLAGWVDRPARITEQTKWRYWSAKLENCLRSSDSRYCLKQWQANPQYAESFSDERMRSRLEALFTLGLEEKELMKRVDIELREFANRVEQARRARKDGHSLLNGAHKINRRVLHDLHFGTASAEPISCRAKVSALIYGEADFVLDPRSQMQAWIEACGQPEDITILPGLGHSLGHDPYYGPTDPAALQVVTGAIVSVASRLASAAPAPPSANTSAPAAPSSSAPRMGSHR